MNRELQLRWRVRWLTWFFITGLFLSGATAIPLASEVGFLARLFPVPWITHVETALTTTEAHFPFLFYGTDWLAFGHFMIALVFVGALRDPVRNRWLFDFGLIACALVLPYAFIFGTVRGIPFWWRCIDCSFGVFGAIPLWFCRRWVGEIESFQRLVKTSSSS